MSVDGTMLSFFERVDHPTSNDNIDNTNDTHQHHHRRQFTPRRLLQSKTVKVNADELALAIEWKRLDRLQQHAIETGADVPGIDMSGADEAQDYIMHDVAKAVLASKELSEAEIKKAEMHKTKTDILELADKRKFELVRMIQSVCKDESEINDVEIEKLATNLRSKLCSMGKPPIVSPGPSTCSLLRNVFTDSAIAPTELPVLSRAYEEAQMIEPDLSDSTIRPCFRGHGCETRRMCELAGVRPFTMREFLYPKDMEHLQATGKLPDMRGECLMCLRLATAFHFCQLLFDGRDATTMITSHWNVCDVEGEYSSNVCFTPPGRRFTGVMSPIVAHDREIYTISFDDETIMGRVSHIEGAVFRTAPIT